LERDWKLLFGSGLWEGWRRFDLIGAGRWLGWLRNGLGGGFLGIDGWRWIGMEVKVRSGGCWLIMVYGRRGGLIDY
jgi:hypothetical protein